jgi:actin-like ATPase involved in cell morphogenesis
MSRAAAPTAEKSWQRDRGLPFQRMDEEAIVVNPRTREVHLLNESAARIWELLDEPLSIPQICEALRAELEGDPPDLRADVEAFVADMGGKGLLLPA